MTSAPTKSEKTKAISKRQARKHGLNPTNTWQQQPKIKSMTEREKAYLRNAGFGKSQQQRQQEKAKGTIDPQVDFINSPEYKFGRLLASPLARTRHATILKLKEYLKARTDPSNEDGGLSILDLMKLWKGMWHTLYLCDGAVVQEEVSKVLAELLWSVGGNQEEDEYAGRVYLEMEEEDFEINDHQEEEEDEDEGNEDQNDVDDDQENAAIEIIEMEESDDEEIDHDHDHDSDFGDDDKDMEEEDGALNPAQEENVKHCRGAHLSALYVRTFFRTLTREWSNMDKYRIDKFYTLMRFILREVYRYMAARHWNLGIIRLFNDAIFEEVLRTNKYGNGVRFHILDITLDELAKVNSEESTGLPLTEATFLDALEPYFALAQRVDDKMVQQRVMEKVLLKFLDEYSVVGNNYNLDPDETDEAAEKARALVMNQVHVGTVGQFIFELASDTETADNYRKSLYEMHKTYMKRIKTVGRDVALMEEEEEDDDDDTDEKEDTKDGALVEEEVAVAVHGTLKDTQETRENKHHVKEKQDPNSTVEPELESEQKKSKKKKKKKNKKSNPIEDTTLRKEQDDDLQQQQDDEMSNNNKKRKSKLEVSTSKIDIKVVADETTQPPKKKKKKKQTKKEEEKKTKTDFTLTEEEEEVITISKKEQKAAAQAVLKAAKTIKAKEEHQHKKKSEDSKRSKKVKFGDMNQSKSYKASMKDLKKVNPKAILEKTPEKSILLKKDKDKKRKSRH
jgi:hypothetical protein